MQTSLQGRADKAKSDKRHRFRHLFGLLNAPFLWQCWRELRKDAASGVDRVTAAGDGQHVIGNVPALIARVTRGAYRAKLV